MRELKLITIILRVSILVWIGIKKFWSLKKAIKIVVDILWNNALSINKINNITKKIGLFTVLDLILFEIIMNIQRDEENQNLINQPAP